MQEERRGVAVAVAVAVAVTHQEDLLTVLTDNHNNNRRSQQRTPKAQVGLHEKKDMKSAIANRSSRRSKLQSPHAPLLHRGFSDSLPLRRGEIP